VLPLLQASTGCISWGQNSASERFATQSHQLRHDLLIPFSTIAHMANGFLMTRAASSHNVAAMLDKGNIVLKFCAIFRCANLCTCCCLSWKLVRTSSVFPVLARLKLVRACLSDADQCAKMSSNCINCIITLVQHNFEKKSYENYSFALHDYLIPRD
jgi:hypothetical protein